MDGLISKIPSSLNAPLPLSLFMRHLIFQGFCMPQGSFRIITLTGGIHEAGYGSPGPVKKHTRADAALLCCV